MSIADMGSDNCNQHDHQPVDTSTLHAAAVPFFHWIFLGSVAVGASGAVVLYSAKGLPAVTNSPIGWSRHQRCLSNHSLLSVGNDHPVDSHFVAC